jgi:putative transposase
MWTEITREDYCRDELVYTSDIRDEEWAELAPLLPPPRRLGRPREWQLREIVDALLYIGSSGCRWRALPACLAGRVSAAFDGAALFLRLARRRY